jgi:uncharacterized protein (TIGR02147 family)
MPDIYQYLDYRIFLRDYFNEEKELNKNFSHQYFARKAGIGSTGFVLHVIKHERNLTKPVLLKIARAMGLNAKQTSYFEALVSFDQAKTPSDKDCYYTRIAEHRKTISIKTVDEQQYEFYSAWYNSVIRELITLRKSNNDPKYLAKLLLPPVSPAQVKKSLKVMESLGIIKKNHEGAYSQKEPFLSGGGPVRNLAIVNYQKEMINHSLEAWNRFQKNEISMNTLTLCMSEALVEKIRAEIQDFKKRLLEIVSAEKIPPERVYNININLFPVTKSVKGL